jgi:hypothetical protein
MAFLLLHALTSVTVDAQVFLPSSLILPALRKVRALFSARCRDRRRQVFADYIRDSGDPLLPNALRTGFEWFRVALYMEVLVHLPIFLVGAHGLYKGEQSVAAE